MQIQTKLCILSYRLLPVCGSASRLVFCDYTKLTASGPRVNRLGFLFAHVLGISSALGFTESISQTVFNNILLQSGFQVSSTENWEPFSFPFKPKEP